MKILVDPLLIEPNSVIENTSHSGSEYQIKKIIICGQA